MQRKMVQAGDEGDEVELHPINGSVGEARTSQPRVRHRGEPCASPGEYRGIRFHAGDGAHHWSQAFKQQSIAAPHVNEVTMPSLRRDPHDPGVVRRVVIPGIRHQTGIVVTCGA